MATYTSVYPPAHSATYVKATSTSLSGTSYPYFATDPTTSVTGTTANQCWLSFVTFEEQKFNIDLGSVKNIRRIYLENLHNSGTNTHLGIKNFLFYGTNSATAFANTTYSNTDDLTLLGTFEATEHPATDTADPQYFALSSNGANYRYYVLRIVDSYNITSSMGFRRIELQIEDGILVSTGGGVAGGVADGTSSRIITSDGGAVAGGSATILNGAIFISTGGGVASGDAKIAHEANFGGAIGLSGRLDITQWNNSLVGTLGLGGNIEIYRENSAEISGQIGLSGLINVTQPNVLSLVGGIGLSGLFEVSQDERLSMSGSLGLSGVINVANQNLFTINGTLGLGSQIIVSVDDSSDYSLSLHNSDRWT